MWRLREAQARADIRALEASANRQGVFEREPARALLQRGAGQEVASEPNLQVSHLKVSFFFDIPVYSGLLLFIVYSWADWCFKRS